MFTSWQDYYGPELHNLDNFTSVSRYNLDDGYSLDFNISNYGDLKNITPQVFQAENMLLLQDGGCASTCTTFSEFMKTQVSVPQVAFGGRRQNGPVQGVGSVKGSQILSFQTLYGFYTQAYQYAEPADQVVFEEAYGKLNASFLQAFNRAAVGADGKRSGSVNYRNSIREGDESVTPLQFVYEAADCRLFYTIETTLSQEAAWKAAYNANWGNGDCVPGSTGHPSSVAGSHTFYAPPDEASNFFGAERLSSWPLNLEMLAASSA